MRKGMLFLLTTIFAVFLLGACSNHDKTNGTDTSGKIKVVTTYSIVYDIVKNIGGDLVEIHSLAPIGSNPHEYDPLPLDVQKTTDADAVFYNGLNLEAGNAWFDNLMETAGKDGQDAPVFQMSEGVKAKYLTTKGKEGEEDPHAWMNIQNGIIYAENARDGLIKVDPEHADIYKKNADEYIAKLEQLHEEAIEKFNKLPKDQRILVTSEGAFKYFSEAYGFVGEYIWEINQENQGTPDQITRIVDIIKEKKIKGLFLETSIDARSMEAVSSETNTPIKGMIFTDSLGHLGEDGDTYITMMEWNINTIFEGLSE